VRDVVSAVDAIAGSGAFHKDVDFLVLSTDFEESLPADVPVFAHGSVRCQRGVVLLPLNDCLGGLVDHFANQELCNSMHPKGNIIYLYDCMAI